MNDEIKEINIKILGQILDYVDTKEHLLDLFNYITNLQQIEQDHKETNATLMNELAKLEEENERLNNQLDFIDEQNKYIDRLEKIIKRLQNGGEEK